MKPKTKRAKTADKNKRTITAEQVVAALHKSGVPSRFVRKEVKLSGFPWGNRLKAWIDEDLPKLVTDGKCGYLSGPSDQAITACAMLTRTLVMRGRDAVYCSLADLMTEGYEPRQSEYLVVAGFFDMEFHGKRGCPMTSQQAYLLSWKLWRLASEGTTIVAFVSPSPGGMAEWWVNGALENMFDRSSNLYLIRSK